MEKAVRLFILLLLVLIPSVFLHAQPAKVSPNHRYLETSTGEPFIWIGDTAWELFHKLDRSEALDYLENRADKGFTIIQAVALAELDGLRTPNAYGDVPFHNLDPTQPNEAYFEHVDYIVHKADSLGLTIGLLPTWGDKLESAHPGAGPVVFNTHNARAYGQFLGARYKNAPIVWILGGDRNIINKDVLETWRAMAQGLQEGDDGKHLITYHPRGGTISAYFLHNEPWLDFNMYQSGHGQHFTEVYRYAERLSDYQPNKPFVDGEPAYEDIAIKFWEYLDWSKPGLQRVPQGVLDKDGLIKDTSYFADGFFTAYDVRVHGYWNFLAGACGYTYGNNAIWQMFNKGDSPAIPALTDWRGALDRPGAQDMTHLRALLESRPFELMVPDQAIIFGDNPTGKMHMRAARAADGSYLMVYQAIGQPVTIHMNKISGQAVIAWWYNPRNGNAHRIDEYSNDGLQTFKPAAQGVKNDWVLVLDSKSANYPPPGKWQTN